MKFAALVAIALSFALPMSAASTSFGKAWAESEPIPAQELKRIRAEYGKFAYVPRSIPKGYIFTSWKVEQPSASYLMPRLKVTFGRAGALLVWTVSDGRDDQDYAECSGSPSYGFEQVINGRRVYYAKGNHGDSAWTCFTPSGSKQPIGIDLWNGHTLSRSTAMQMVASASLSTAPAPTSKPATRVGFKTPTGNIACVIRGVSPVSGDPSSIDCFVRKAKAVWSLPAYSGRARRIQTTRFSTEGLRVLRYGQRWQFVVTCNLERRGLTCRNLSKNGFFLSDSKQRTF